jgi:hypothetical protein
MAMARWIFSRASGSANNAKQMIASQRGYGIECVKPSGRALRHADGDWPGLAPRPEVGLFAAEGRREERYGLRARALRAAIAAATVRLCATA